MSSLVVSEAAMQNAERNIRKELPMVSGTCAQGSSLAVTLAGQRGCIPPFQYMQELHAAGIHARRLVHLGQREQADAGRDAGSRPHVAHRPVHLQRSVFSCDVRHA